MSSILLFNIGFRSENICRELKRYKKDQQINEYILDDSKSIIIDCFNIEKLFTDSFSHSNFSSSEFYPLIFNIFPNKDVPEITKILKAIDTTFNNISEGSLEENIEDALSFFNTLSDLCLTYQEKNSEMTTSFM